MTKKTTKKSVRLPSYSKPSRYAITVKPDLEAFTFSGEEVIDITISQATKTITLHSKELQVESAELNYASKTVLAEKITYNEKSETVDFNFANQVPKGKARLTIIFRGALSDQLYGYYRSKYVVDGKEKFLATTQFEPTSARRAFPCFDEPAHKAVFDVKMVVPIHHTAISNTLPATITEHEAGYKIVQFEPTPKMSTYLLAFISGEFEHLEGKSKSGVLVRVFTTAGKKHQGAFGLEVAIKVLDFYEKYFDIKYPLPTLDMIAIPDFNSGAMENWGAVTYRESQFLVDPKRSSAITKQWSAITIAHELAHQWFGNLVTMEWWTHLWLNESFAAYIEYLAVDHLFPQWDMWTQFAYLDAGSAFSLDSLDNTHSIEVEVHHPDEIDEIFDAISYQKGSSVIRMLAEYLGERHFRAGLRHYLKKHSYQNAQTNDLWKAFEHVSKKPVRKIMNAWTSNAGHPVVTVFDEGKKLRLTQSRFYSSEHSRKGSKNKSIWPIPLGVTALGSNKNTYYIFDKKSVVIPKPKSKKGIKLNPGETGFYHVDYPEHYIANFKAAIKANALSPRDRLGIVSNLFALAENGQFSTAEVFNLIDGMKKESDYTVWLELMSSIREFEYLTHGEAYEKKFRRFAQKLFSVIVGKLGWQKKPNEQYTHSMLRGSVLFQYGHFGHKPTVHRALKYFREFIAGKRTIAPDFRGFIYQTVAENGGKQEYEAMLKKYKSEQLNEERNRLARALAAFQQKSLINKTLAFSLSNHVLTQEFSYIFDPLFANPNGTELAWQFMQLHWDKFLTVYGQGHTLQRHVQMLEVFSTNKKAKEIAAFFKTHPAPAAERTVRQVLEKIKSNTAWRNRSRAELVQWFG